ncbi:DUF1566 domain-containing protein [Dyella sp.]|uniref:Lcl C-terminal domain-containing protein n=1 Tax=Dyella sp. TaxID=1869338 RepID=UPI002FD981D5
MNAVAETSAPAASGTIVTTRDGLVVDFSKLYKDRAKYSAALVQLDADATDHAIVYDPLTGLMEAINAPGFDKSAKPDTLIKRAKELDFAGYQDWSIPDVPQAVHAVDYTRTGPAADPNLYPDAVSDWYLCQQTQWTLNETGGSRSFWSVGMDYGYVGNDLASNEFRARPVRVAAPAGQFLALGQ